MLVDLSFITEDDVKNDLIDDAKLCKTPKVAKDKKHFKHADSRKNHETKKDVASINKYLLVLHNALSTNIMQQKIPCGDTTNCGVKKKKTKKVSKLHNNNNNNNTIPRNILESLRIVELGAGTGITGIISGALNARAVLITDLSEVVDGITLDNIHANRKLLYVDPQQQPLKMRVKGIPLCWGNLEDETIAKLALDELSDPPILLSNNITPSNNEIEQNIISQESIDDTQERRRDGIPDLLLIGDVAYQHKPGAPSHFDVLLETMLRLTDELTIVVFGTRIRMEASKDLTDMILAHFEHLCAPVQADEIDPAFATVKKHNIEVHLLRRRCIIE
uniref:Uncharacterized protein n=1 Tax=Proboscia inermis TaxID=420281 RepID=A0A6T8HPX2_9STRA|mmetsp:Transcript_21762/g.22127  ORF Transcript_21762/g.22127 Transcript_21762/m.22127 type:complete len:333 (+) Transcript_21762:442-1440(+)